MGQITFKGGSITFKGGSLTFLSYTPMAEPTVKVQWIYESGKYRAKVSIKNNDAYNAKFNHIVTLGTEVLGTYKTTSIAPGGTFTNNFYNLDRSPDNEFLFKVEAFSEDVSAIRPNSATISKETRANFRRYLYNLGDNAAGLLEGPGAGNSVFNEDTFHIYISSRSSGSLAYMTVLPGGQVVDSSISPSTDKKLWIDWTFFNGDGDGDFIEITYKTTYKETFNENFGQRENYLNIVEAGDFGDILIKLSDYTYPGSYPSAYIYKLYIETINNGDPV